MPCHCALVFVRRCQWKLSPVGWRAGIPSGTARFAMAFAAAACVAIGDVIVL